MADPVTNDGPSEVGTGPPLGKPETPVPSDADRVHAVLTHCEAAERKLTATAEVMRQAAGERKKELDPLKAGIEELKTMLAPIIFFLVVNTIAVIVIAIKVFKH